MYINFLNKNIFSTILASLLIVSSFHSNFATAAGNCKILIEESFRSEIVSTFQISRLNGVEEIQIKPAIIVQLKKELKAKGIKLHTKSTRKIRELIAAVAQQIKGDTDVASIEKSNQMAEVGRLILNTVKADLNPAQTKMITYMIAESVLKLETFKISEFKTEPLDSLFTTNSVIHIDKFHEMTESYIDGAATYNNFNRKSNGYSNGVLYWPDIRRLYANNSWVISNINGDRLHHDMFHIHYSYGHPYYLAVNLHASRSINDRRYAMISSLWESVDNYRTSYEKKIAEYFQSKSITAEDAMLFLGSAPEKELDQIGKELDQTAPVIGGTYDKLSEISYAAGWRPVKTTFGRGSMNYNEATFLKEIEDFINTSLTKMKDLNNAKYINYHREGPGVSVETDQNTIP